MMISIVTTLYKSEEFISEFYKDIVAALNEIGTSNYEIIFVDDGSPDQSDKICKGIIKSDKRVSLIKLSRNFGHHKAILAGLNEAKGERIFLIDVDLEEDPNWLTKFTNILEKENVDCVYGVQVNRRGKNFEKLSGWMYYKLINFFSSIDVPHNLVTARLMTRKYLDSMLMFKEKDIAIGAFYILTGYKQIGIEVDKKSSSQSTYTLSEKIDTAVRGITSLSSKPLEMIFYFGLFTVFISIIFILVIIYYYMIHGIAQGWASLATMIIFFSGMMISFLGMIGLYLGKVLTEVKRRPNYIIEKVFNSDNLN